MHDLHELPGDVVLDIVALGDGSTCTSFPAMHLALVGPRPLASTSAAVGRQSDKESVHDLSMKARPPWRSMTFTRSCTFEAPRSTAGKWP